MYFEFFYVCEALKSSVGRFSVLFTLADFPGLLYFNGYKITFVLRATILHLDQMVVFFMCSLFHYLAAPCFLDGGAHFGKFVITVVKINYTTLI
jgi:hypothetical protein